MSFLLRMTWCSTRLHPESLQFPFHRAVPLPGGGVVRKRAGFHGQVASGSLFVRKWGLFYGQMPRGGNFIRKTGGFSGRNRCRAVRAGARRVGRRLPRFALHPVPDFARDSRSRGRGRPRSPRPLRFASLPCCGSHISSTPANLLPRSVSNR